MTPVSIPRLAGRVRPGASSSPPKPRPSLAQQAAQDRDEPTAMGIATVGS